MKKLLRFSFLSLIVFVFHTPSIGQYLPEPYSYEVVVVEQHELKSSLTEGDLIWSEDFSGGLPENWLNINSNGFCAFTHSYTGPRGPFSIGVPALGSTSAYNGFMILDSDLCSSQNPGGVVDAYLETPPIDLSSHPNILLRFQHNFRYCCTEEQSRIQVEISKDYVNWAIIDIKNGIKPNHMSANPVNQSLNISHLAGGQEQVWIRFRKIGASHYWWMIDDVKLVSYIENDLAISSVEFNHGYTRTPYGQQQPFNFKARIKNDGGVAQTQIVLNAQVNNYLFNATSTKLSTLAAGQLAVLAVDSVFQPLGLGRYNVKLDIQQNETDEKPSNNYFEGYFMITDTVYSRSRNIYDPEPKMQAALGNRFKISENMQATSVSFALHENTQVGQKLKAVVYRISGTNFTEISQSAEWIVTENEISYDETPVWVSLPLITQANLAPGDYLAAVVPSTDGITIAAQRAIAQPDGASYTLLQNQWQSVVFTPMINLNFGHNKGECTPMYHFITIPSLCKDSTGSAHIIPITGVGPYSYIWNVEPSNATSLLENVAAGKYAVTATDGYGCEVELEIEIENGMLEADIDIWPAHCGEDGAIEIFMIEGTGPFVYAWEHDSQNSSAQAAGLIPGFYNVLVVDAENCKAEIKIEIENIDSLPVDVVVSKAYCNNSNGQIQLIPLSGTSPFVFSWDKYPSVTGSSLSNLAPGLYSFTVTDNRNCKFSGKTTISHEQYSLQVSTSIENATCGLNNGILEAHVENGKAPYQYFWSHGLKTSLINNVAAGSYSVTVLDERGCEGKKSVVVTNTGTQPAVEWEKSNSAGCNNQTGSISVLPVNSSDVYIFQMIANDGNKIFDVHNKSNNFFADNLGAGVYTIKITNDQQCEKKLSIDISDSDGPVIKTGEDGIKNISCFGRKDGSIIIQIENSGTNPQYLWNDSNKSTGTRLDDLASGVYTVQVTNDQGCKSVASFEVKEPAMLLANAVVAHPDCQGNTGSIQLSLLGGSGPYTFIWNTGATSRNISDLAPGKYNVKITDYSYCTFENEFTINDSGRLVVTYSIEDENEEKSNGSVSLTVKGGDGNFTYNWNTGQDTPVVSGLPAGQYTVIIRDGSGCETTETIRIGTVDVYEKMRATSKLLLYPNPVKDNLFLRFVPASQTYNIEIYNISGKLVYTSESHAIPDEETSLTIQTTNLQTGMYILRVSSIQEVWQTKFLKQ